MSLEGGKKSFPKEKKTEEWKEKQLSADDTSMENEGKKIQLNNK